MFNLVNDVASYPQFISGCVAASTESAGERQAVATLAIAKGPVETRLITHNRWQENEWIDMQLIEGPLRSLDARWRFADIAAAGTRVDFCMQFELQRSIMGVAVNPVIERLLESMVDVFVQRAQALHG